MTTITAYVFRCHGIKIDNRKDLTVRCPVCQRKEVRKIDNELTIKTPNEPVSDSLIFYNFSCCGNKPQGINDCQLLFRTCPTCGKNELSQSKKETIVNGKVLLVNNTVPCFRKVQAPKPLN